MNNDKYQRYFLKSLFYFSAFLIGGIFFDPLWRFIGTCWQFIGMWVGRWWVHHGPFKIVFDLVCTAFIVWLSERRLTEASRRTVSGASVNHRAV